MIGVKGRHSFGPGQEGRVPGIEVYLFRCPCATGIACLLLPGKKMNFYAHIALVLLCSLVFFQRERETERQSKGTAEQGSTRSQERERFPEMSLAYPLALPLALAGMPPDILC